MGNRSLIALAEEYFAQVTSIPASFEALGFDAGLDTSFLFEQVEGNVPENSEVRRAIVVALEADQKRWVFTCPC